MIVDGLLAKIDNKIDSGKRNTEL